jgi:hypothetical protein
MHGVAQLNWRTRHGGSLSSALDRSLCASPAFRIKSNFRLLRLLLALLERDRFRRFHLCASGPDC